MWKFIHENLKELSRGFVGGCFAGGGLLWTKQDLLAKGIVPLLVIFISGCLGAMGTALGNDIYKGKFNKRVKKLFTKNKNNARSDKQKAA